MLRDYFLTRLVPFHSFFFFNDPPTTEIYTLSLHDALPISGLIVDSVREVLSLPKKDIAPPPDAIHSGIDHRDRKSTRLNSSHPSISYAVFCLKKKNKKQKRTEPTQKLT